MTFNNLNWLSLTIGVVIIWISIFYWIKFKKSKLSFTKISYKNKIFLLLSLFFAFIGILQPKWFTQNQQVTHKWVDVLFVLDVSKSMNTIDYGNKTTRLELAKQAIKKFITKHPNNKYWLIIFTKQATVSIPFTSDINTFLTLLDWVNYKNLTNQWTDFNNALQQAIKMLNSDPNKWKVLVLISDGWDEGDYTSTNYSNLNFKSIIVWVWNKIGWKIFLWYDDFQEPIFQMYHWRPVITRLNDKNLKLLAKDLQWKYFHLEGENDLEKLNSILENIAKQTYQQQIHTKKDLTRYALIISLIFLLIYIFSLKRWKNY